MLVSFEDTYIHGGRHGVLQCTHLKQREEVRHKTVPTPLPRPTHWSGKTGAQREAGREARRGVKGTSGAGAAARQHSGDAAIPFQTRHSLEKLGRSSVLVFLSAYMADARNRV